MDDIYLSEMDRRTIREHTTALNNHARALAAHAECLGMNAEDCIAASQGCVPPYNNSHYALVLKKYSIIDGSGNPLI